MNQASLAFTAGDNILEGDVINDVTGSILLAGGANAVFEDDLENMGVIELAPDGTAVSLTVLGNLRRPAHVRTQFGPWRRAHCLVG